MINLLGVYHYSAHSATEECTDLFGSATCGQNGPQGAAAFLLLGNKEAMVPEGRSRLGTNLCDDELSVMAASSTMLCVLALSARVRVWHIEIKSQLIQVSSLPFADNTFHKAMAVNSLQIWPDTIAGMREMWRVMKSGGTIALGFTPYSGQKKEGLADKLIATGFTKAYVVEKGRNFCALATKP